MAHQELNISEIPVPPSDLVEIVQGVWKLVGKLGVDSWTHSKYAQVQHSCLSLPPRGSQGGKKERQAGTILKLN